MHKEEKEAGFTIIELLIVIVVIAILAAISIVAYTGMQQRARDTKRLNDARSIIRSLEAYRAVHGSCPSQSPNTNSNNTCGSGHTNGYTYSTSTDGRWLQALISSETVSSAPIAPGNDCTSYYRYIYRTANLYGCTERTNNYAIFQVYGVEGMARPSGSETATWRPCPDSATGWSVSGNWTFILEE